MNPKIEELRFKLKTDPRSRLFYQLAEELRKAGEFEESEQVLRTGLVVYPAYLAAWVSLGRVLRELKNNDAAVEALSTALQLDPGNVVAARLVADSYLALGNKVEAIKKYKLVHALLPSDEALEAEIERLERELHEPAVALAEEEPAAPAAGPEITPMEDSPFDRTVPPFEEDSLAAESELRRDALTGDSEPMAFAHEESPFEEPADGFTAEAVEVESPAGVHVTEAVDVPAQAAVADDADSLRVAKLEHWLAKVGKREVGRV